MNVTDIITLVELIKELPMWQQIIIYTSMVLVSTSAFIAAVVSLVKLFRKNKPTVINNHYYSGKVSKKESNKER
jgi:uncharacterized protein (DUF983 family)